jgi:hypothetical protein
MSEMHRPNQGREEYEHQDVGAGGVIGFLIGLGVVGVVIYFIVLGMYGFLDRYEAARQVANPLQAPQADTRVVTTERIEHKFPKPLLQKDDVGEMREQLMRESGVLSTYDWIDEADGQVRIPIDRAMALTAERGLPVRGTAAAAPAGAKAAKTTKTAKH